MSTPDVERLRSIKTFPSLVKYLRDELEWPIDSDDFDELTFDYEPEELGLDAKTAVKIKEIKQLRPLASNQPWGIFFVNFEPKRLPVVVLRRILRSLVIRKRQSANKPQQAAWQLHDLLFISAYGESEHRDITLANFSDDSEAGDLPTLKVLGWDDEDTVLHLAHAHDVLKEKLHWPENPADLDNWRRTWSQAFTLKHREVIGTSKEMAERMAELATAIRKRVNNVLAVESDKGPMRKLMTAFREALIHDLKEDDFADMYAQTITYGLLSARVSRPAGLVAENIRDMVPITNPFLRDLLSTFLTVGGRKGKVDFDELGINEVVQALRDANMEAVMRDFDDKNPQEDPVIHFYELFLKEYDPKKRMQRGVFFTPRPVVSFIVRSVDEILRKEFGLADGLADTTTWGEMARRHPQIKIPDGAKPEDPFVQILDPACGTGTFLVEVIDVIHQSMKAKWRKQGHMVLEFQNLWNEYVSDHLLPRLYGFELMMAPYAIAHMKIGLKLGGTGYRFGSHERARIYLTNSIEPPQDFSDRFEFDAPALAHEAQAVNAIKRHQRFTVVIGNPPYSNLSANLTETARAVIEKYKFIGSERVTERNALQLERNLNDDYVKFIAWSEERLGDSGLGILSMISNSVYTWSPSLRGMRAHLLNSSPNMRILDLHGASQRGPADSRFADDENVFAIEQPVAIGTFWSKPTADGSAVAYAELVGPRSTKYTFLLEHTSLQKCFTSITLTPPARRFTPSPSDHGAEYNFYFPLSSICPLFAEGIKTGRDWLVIDFDSSAILERMQGIQESEEDDDALCERIGLSRKKAWNFTRARAALLEVDVSKYISPIAYRPMDERKVFYHPDWISSPSAPVMRNLSLAQPPGGKGTARNFAILAGRISRDHVSRLYWCTSRLTDKCILSSLDNVSVFPALVLPSRAEGMLGIEQTLPEPNLSNEFLSVLAERLDLRKPEGNPELLSRWVFKVFHYLYAALWSPVFRERYGGELDADFPRLPLTSSIELFRALAKLGGELVALHLMESPKLEKYITKYAGRGGSEVATGYPKYTAETVRINPTRGFEGVPENVWNFHIGGYQVCEKWLKDRRGRTLSDEDITHYQKIVVALNETIRLMAEIDKVIEAHGGWPGAFLAPTKGLPKEGRTRSSPEIV